MGVIPGPKELSLEEINHFLWPLVDFFLAAWKVGTWFTKTTAHAMGHLIWSVIALVISDLPAAHKISGFVAPTSWHLCNLCWLQKSDIGDFDADSWKWHTFQEYCDAAIQWRDADMKKQQDTYIWSSKRQECAGLSFFICCTGTPLISLLLTACTTFSLGWHSFNSGTSSSLISRKIKTYANPWHQHSSLQTLQS